jgi:hypothetical protein
MSAKSRERKQKQLAREQALQSSQNAPPPETKKGEYFQPIEYFDKPPLDSGVPYPNTSAEAHNKPSSKNSISMSRLIQSGFHQKPIEGFD